MAHITGGGIEGNLSRIIPDGLTAEIDLSKIQLLPIFKFIKTHGNISDEEMLNTFNCGVGFNVVVPLHQVQEVKQHIQQFYPCYEIGKIKKGVQKITFTQQLNWL